MRKRTDGYHDIASLYQAIDLSDRLFFSWAEKDAITCTSPAIACDSGNLAAKAVALFRSRFALRPIHIHIEKRIPMQAGLGGGSSNAAATLKALNTLTGHPASTQELIQMSAAIGSDVPFFFSTGTAYCTGRGEILEPFTLPSPLSGWLAKPSYGLATPLVYQNTRVEECIPRDPLTTLKNYPQFYNDLEIPAFRLEPRLAILRNALQRSFKEVVMTGSGTAFFCLDGQPEPIEGVVFIPFKSLEI